MKDAAEVFGRIVEIADESGAKRRVEVERLLRELIQERDDRHDADITRVTAELAKAKDGARSQLDAAGKKHEEAVTRLTGEVSKLRAELEATKKALPPKPTPARGVSAFLAVASGLNLIVWVMIGTSSPHPHHSVWPQWFIWQALLLGTAWVAGRVAELKL